MNSTTNNNRLSFFANMSGPNPSSVGFFPQISSVSSSDLQGFGVFQLTTVGASDATIRTLVPVSISVFPYRKVLIATLFFLQILGSADCPSISISDLVSTVASYFDMSTAMAKRETELMAIFVRDSIFLVDNMSVVGFLYLTGKSVTINDPDNRPRDVSYFIFRSSLNPNAVEDRVTITVHQFEFSLRLPQNSTSSFVSLSLPIPSVVPNQSSVPTFDAAFSCLSDDLLNQMLATEIRDILSAQRGSLSTSYPSTTSRSLKFFNPNSSTTTVATSSTQKLVWSTLLLLPVPIIPHPSFF